MIGEQVRRSSDAVCCVFGCMYVFTLRVEVHNMQKAGLNASSM